METLENLHANRRLKHIKVKMTIDRFSLGGSTTSFAYRLPKWRIPDTILLVLIILINIPVYFQPPFQRQFILNDPTLSHPYELNERVTDFMLVIYSLVLPCVVIIVVWYLLVDRRHKWNVLYVSLLGLFLSWFTTALFTNFIKNWFGRPRPDFIDRCQPRPNMPINTLFTADEVCTNENEAILLEGFRSTPSGHSSESFAGLGYLFFWLCGQLLTEHEQVGIWRKYVAMIPLLIASLIALSRTQDYRHHFVDIFLGSIIGFLISYGIYRKYFPSISSQVPFKPLLDNSDVTFDVPSDSTIISSSTYQRRIPLPQDEEMGPLSA